MTYMYKSVCVYVNLKVFRDACIFFLHTCYSSLYFSLVFCPRGRFAVFAKCVTL